MEATERRKLKTEARREAILRSAARAFSRRGYHGTSMDDISEQLLMTKGSLYYYFKDKEEILFACHDYSLNLVNENLDRVQKLKVSTDQKLAALIAAHIEVMLDALQGSAMALDFTALSPALLEKVIEKRDRFEKGMRAIIQQGVKEKLFRPVDAKLAVFMILGSINWIAKWYREGGRYDASSIAREYAGIFITGLKAGRAFEAQIPELETKAMARAGA